MNWATKKMILNDAKLDRQKLIDALDGEIEAAKQQIEQRVTDYFITGVAAALYNRFGFQRSRLTEVFRATEYYLAEVQGGYTTIDELRATLRDEIGFEFKNHFAEKREEK